MNRLKNGSGDVKGGACTGVIAGFRERPTAQAQAVP
jgi:hypothetical protein